MRMDRRAGLLSGGKLTLRQLWNRASLVQGYGITGSTTANYTMTIEGGTETPVWVVCCTGNGIDFSKIKNNVITSLKTARVTTTYPPVYTAAASGSDTVLTMTGKSYGVIFTVFRFPGLSEAAVDLCLSSMVLEALTGHNRSDSRTVSVDASLVTADKMYIQTFVVSTAPKFSVTQGANNLLYSMDNIIHWYYYAANDVYRLSADGESNSMNRVGGIYSLSDAA